MGLRERYAAIVERLVDELRAQYGDLPRGRTARLEEFLPVERRLEPCLAPPRSEQQDSGAV